MKKREFELHYIQDKTEKIGGIVASQRMCLEKVNPILLT